MKMLFYTAGHTPALAHSIALLKEAGIPFCDTPDLAATHLLLPVPSFGPDGLLRGGGDIEVLLPQLSKQICIVGGNLNCPLLAGYQVVDLLRDPAYLAENAGITAHCAVKLAMQKLPVTLRGCKVLVIGWGRIGKCLAALLKQMGAIVTVAARKPEDRAMLHALDYDAVSIDEADTGAYRVVFNSVPVMVLPVCPGEALKIDLASVRGIGGSDVLWAKGLPGTDAPESSGRLIARTVLRSVFGKEEAL